MPDQTNNGSMVINVPSYVGRLVCAECHAEQDRFWRGSPHDLAMQKADSKSVLGDFADRSFAYNGITSRFFTRNGRYWVATDGPDGKLQEYPIRYTFGFDPLQQYLVEFPDGRLQALSIAWDARSDNDGGQRWFHLFPDEGVDYRDVLHWTQASQNWNGRCAACHSTHLQKRYHVASDIYDSGWSEIDVSCEACHGPGSQHVPWARKNPGWQSFESSKGLRVHLDERSGVEWTIDPNTGNAARSKSREKDTEIEICAPCHSRRGAISDDYTPGDPFLDHYRPALLSADLYYPDGQILDEVYVYGSFLQSRMFHAGVTCSDCHEPHRATLRKAGDRICLDCHAEQKYKAGSHHFHPEDSPGSSCIGCHMPTRTYMVVDVRHDHSFRFPRPDLSVRLGTPNTCNQCHSNRTAEWAAMQVKNWYGHTPQGFQHYAEALAAARHGDPNATRQLAELIQNPATPDIARATALAEFGPYLTRGNKDLIGLGLLHDNPLVRLGTIALVEQTPPALRVQLLTPLLEDSMRAVRIDAARALSAIPQGFLNKERPARFNQGIQEYIRAQEFDADNPEAQVNLGIIYGNLGELTRAVDAYRTAIKLSRFFIPAYINLADLYRSQGKDDQGEKVLREALDAVPENAEAHYALGLLLVRAKQPEKALLELKTAAKLDSGDFRYDYTYAIALNSGGRTDEAIKILEKVHERFPNNFDILAALIALNRDLGHTEAAENYERRLQALSTGKRAGGP
ncbi:MAG: tetratricopeptide repeat protein [Gammaproteobacteria bacterium]